ncbi:MAG: hypothetical protein U0791_18090 [Gemmataceae bacterium]
MSREIPLDDRLDGLASRVRRQRILAGASLSALLAVSLFLLIAFLDARFDWSANVRAASAIGGLCLVAAIAWRTAVRAWLSEPPLEEVAERMMADDSPNVVAALAREEKEHRHYPSRPSFTLASLAGLAAVITVAVAMENGERVRRIAIPWHTRTAIAPFEIVVVSGNAVARRGEPVTLTAYLKPRDPSASMPGDARLRTRDREIPMEGANGAFHATLPAAESDFEYRVEAGSETSEWFTTLIADPVELAPNSSLTIAPPQYLAGCVKPNTVPFAELEAVQHSTAAVQLRFTRPAESATLEWRPDDRNPFESADVIPITLAADRRSGTAMVPLRANGMLRAVLVNETGPRRLQTETAVGVRVRIDQPPRFERLEGIATQPRTARPGQQLRILFTATDDFGIDSASLELEKGPTPILLERTGPTRAEGLATITMPANEGEAIRVRLRVRDTRRVPSEALAAQEIVFPPAGWFEVKASFTGQPFAEQQIAGQRDSVKAALAAACARFDAWRAELETIKSESKPQGEPALDHTLRLAVIRDQVRETRVALERCEAEVRLTAELAPLGDRIAAFVGGPVQEVEAAIDGASNTSTARLMFVVQARAEAEGLASFNDRFARYRLDRVRLQALANEVDTGTPAASLAELKRIIAESEPLTRGQAALASTESQRLAAAALRLRIHLQELDAAALGLSTGLRKEVLAEHAAAQAELAKTAVEFTKRWEAPLRLASLAPPKRDSFERVVQSLHDDKPVDALTAMEQLAAALDKLAGECGTWTADRTDAKLAGAQFAKWQADLRMRFVADPKTAPAAEQRALIAAVEAMHMPPGDMLRESVLIHARLALQRIELSNPAAEVAMRLSAQALERLADKTPTLQDRHNRSRIELDKLRKEQEEILTYAERAIRSFDKLVLTPAVMQNLAVKLEPLQIRQSRWADRAAALDVPRHELRQARVVLAAKAAAADLKDGLPYDCLASLGACIREFGRLKQSLENTMPADVRAAELAGKQSEALRLVLAAGNDAPAKAWEPVVALQRDIANAAGLADFAAPEAPGLVADARKAVELAELSLRDGSNFDTIVRRLRDAKESLTLLADRLNDREPEKDRMLRFAAMRRTAECNAKRLAGRMPNPDASAAARAELDGELADLAMTRVGAAGQAAKRKALDAYLRLMNRPDPDRQASDQKQLADVLAEIAGPMAKEARLTTRPDFEQPMADAAGDHLPSAKPAAELRELAKRERELRERVNTVNAVVAARVKPAATAPFAKLESRQRLFAESLLHARNGSFLVAALQLKAARAAIRAADRLAVGDRAAGLEAIDESIHLLALVHANTKTTAEIRQELVALVVTSNGIAAQHRARHAVLAEDANELARQFTDAVEDGASSLAAAAGSVQGAARSLSEASRKDGEDAARLRADAGSLLAAIPPPKVQPDTPSAGSAALAVREAERVFKQPQPSAESRLRAAAALRRAAEVPFTP